MRVSTAAGSDLGLSITVVVGGLLLARLTGSWRPLLILALAMIGAASLDRLVKVMVARMRPPSLFWAVSADGWSFPSGHATESAAVYFTLANLFSDIQTREIVKALIYALGFAAPFVIGVSRVYLGVHWPTDVGAGWALGAAWSAVVLAAPSASWSKRPERQNESMA
jgi:undecaprenyl-diphosphatase